MAENFQNFSSGINTGLLAADPSPANNGDVYYNTTTNTFRVFQNGIWQNMIGGSANPIQLAQISTPAAPPSGSDNLYFKNDDNLYIQNSAGVEIPILQSGSAAFATYASTQITTQSSTASSSFVTASNSPAFTITPTITGTYKVYASLPGQNDTAGGQAIYQIFNTSGGATLLEASQAAVDSVVSGSVIVNITIQSNYILTAGITYVFDLQYKAVSGGDAYIRGDVAPFYMFAEGVSLANIVQTTGIVANVELSATMAVGGSATQVMYDTVIGDTNNAFNTSTGIYTIPAAGWYDITASGQTSVGVHDNFQILILKNATVVAENNQAIGNTPNIGVAPTPSVVTKILCAVGDQITVEVNNQNGNTSTWGGDPTSNFLCISSITSAGLSKIVRSNTTGNGSTNTFSTSLQPILDLSSNPLTVAVYCNGGDVEVGMINDNSGSTGSFTIDQSPSDSGMTVNIYRDGTIVYSEINYLQNNVSIEIHQEPVNQFRFIDTPTVGMHTYTIQVLLSNNPRSQNTVQYAQLYARPMA